MIGNPRTVPVGQYAEESLKTLGLWTRLEPKLVFAENVRQALLPDLGQFQELAGALAPWEKVFVIDTEYESA